MSSIKFNLQQLEYIVAVDRERHFGRAAAQCFVTQPTLSMMIQKLEDSLGVQIFDRSRQPVTPTALGARLIASARSILAGVDSMQQLIEDEREMLQGALHIGIIPTLAPYLLPRFAADFVRRYPQVDMHLQEWRTPLILEQLKSGQLDMGILATPLNDPALQEQPLFYESFFLYSGQHDRTIAKQKIQPSDIDLDQLWLLEEGHCMRSQVVNFCELKKQKLPVSGLHYAAGSLETLIRLVDRQQGLTIIPELCTLDMSDFQRSQLKSFETPTPVREISLVYSRNYYRQKLVAALSQCICENLPPSITNTVNKRVIQF